MNDLLQSQIKESCKLALPGGLQDLMSDISREVLRHQPQDIYKFIVDYLSVLLVARDNLSIASQLCGEVCTGTCHPELEDELRYIGLNHGDAARAKDIILECFEKSEVNEGIIIQKIMRRTSIDETKLDAVVAAIRNAFIRHQINHTTIFESSSDSDKDEIQRAAAHTLDLYRKAKPSDIEYSQMVTKVQASYRAYGVKRHVKKPKNKTPKKPYKSIQFEETKEATECPNDTKTCLKTVSSTTLAGSYLTLPKYKPYSVHDHDPVEELNEKEHCTINYTEEEQSPTEDQEYETNDGVYETSFENDDSKEDGEDIVGEEKINGDVNKEDNEETGVI